MSFLLVVAPLAGFLTRALTIKISGGETWGFQGPYLITAIIQEFFGSILFQNSLIVFLFSILFVLGLMQLLRIDVKKFFFIIVIIAIPLGMGYIFSYKFPIVPRYFIYLVPFFFIGISFFFLPIKKYFKTNQFLCIVLLFITVISIPYLATYYSHDFKMENWKDISQDIKNLTNAGDVIVIVPMQYQIPFDYYYNNNTYSTYLYGASNPDELDQILITNAEKKIFFVSNPVNSETFEWVKAHSNLIKNRNNICIYQARVMVNEVI